MNNNRELLWDNLKFFLILNVVIGHLILFFLKGSYLCKSLYIFIYSYHMPLFIFIAGYFHSNQKTLSKFYFFLTSGLLLRFLLFAENQLLYKYGVLTLGIESGVPWFMYVMAGFTVLSYIVKECDPKIVLPVSVIVGCFVGYDESVNSFLALSRIFVFFPFYYMGIICKQNETLKSLLYFKTMKKKVLSVVLFVAFFVLCKMCIHNLYFLKMYFNGYYPYSVIWGTDHLNINSGLIRMLCYCITALMGYALIMLMPGNYLPVVSFMGTKTLQIYFWHMIIINFLSKIGILRYVFKANIVLLLLLGILLTLLLGQSLFSFPVKNIRDGCLKYKGVRK